MSDDSLAAYIKAYMDEIIEYYKGYVDYTYADFLEKGTSSYDYSKLTPNTLYTVVAIAMDDKAVASGAATRKNFQTKEVHEDPVPADMTFQFAVDSITFNSAYVAVTPSTNEATYYWNIFETAEIANMTDDALCAAIKSNIEETIETYAMFGYDLTFADFLSKGPDAWSYTELSANTAYTAIAVAMGTEGTTNGVVGKKNFQTAEVVATDSIELDLTSEYLFYADYGVLQITGEDTVKKLELGLAFVTTTPDGTFTLDDCYEDGYYYYNYIYDADTEDIFEFVDLNVTGKLDGDLYKYSGYGIAEDGIKYIFSDAAIEYVAPESAPKKSAAKKEAKNFKKGNLNQATKGFKFVAEKYINK
jgi:hypothetical protein